MSKPKLSKETLIPLGLVLTIGWQVGKPLARLVWDASAAFSEMRAMKPQVDKVEQQMKTYGDSLAQVKTTQAAILQALSDLKRPVYHTRKTVDAVEDQLLALNHNLGPFAPLYPGPVTQN